MESIYLSPPDVGAAERAMLLDAFDSNWVTSVGAHVDAFELEVAELVGRRRAVAVSSGTAALHLALLAAGVRPGDVVLVPSLTFIATAAAAVYIGAEIVFIDVESTTWNVDPELVVAAIQQRAGTAAPVRALITVDLFGACAAYDRLVDTCEEHGVILVEDAAEAFGSTWCGRPAGSFGRAGILSFNGNKIITTGSGGMVLIDDDDLADTVRYLSTQARDPVDHYEHRQVGFNYRMNNLLAALGRAQLLSLPQRVSARQATFDAYAVALDDAVGLRMMPRDVDRGSNRWLSVLAVDPVRFGATADQVRLHLRTQGIEARPTWKPLHLQPAFADRERFGGEVAEHVFRSGLCLPSGSSLTPAQRERVIATILATPRMVRDG